jgi:quercetin dioxygenase-like cupin family protein
MHRRALLQAGVGALAGAAAFDADDAGAAGAGQAPPVQAKNLGTHPLGPAFDGWNGTILEVVYAPGGSSAAHQHPGPTFGYVVSGQIRWAIDGQPARVLHAGESFFEPMGSIHSTSANASETEPARLSVVILGRSGEPLSRPAASKTP